MNKILNGFRARFYVFLGLVLLVAALPIMQTRSQSSNPTIFGCYKRNNGQLRIVPATGQCDPSEIEISWGSGGGDTSLGQHHQESTFIIGPGSGVLLPLPATDKPVHIDFSATGQTDAQNVPVMPLVGTFAAVKEAATGLVTVSDSFGVGFPCGGVIQVNEGTNGVDFLYVQGGCGENPVTVHVNMWY